MNNLISQRREVGEFRKRYKWMALLVVLTFSALGGRVVILQLVMYDHYARFAQDNITRIMRLPAARGVITDRDGRVVAGNRPSYAVYITPQLFDLESQLPVLARLMKLESEQVGPLRNRIESVPPARRSQQIEFFRDISREQLAALETHGRELPGVDVVARPRRMYPFGHLGAHVIGYLNEVNQEDLDLHKGEGYEPGMRIGRQGVERAFEQALRGRGGYAKAMLPSRHGVSPKDSSLVERVEPVAGNNVTLTLDMGLMQIIDRAFRGHPSGAAAVVDAQTGSVLALFSKPSYDLNEIGGGLSAAAYQEMSQSPYRPLIDKAVYETYFPGSTFKALSAIAALGKEGFDATDRVDCPGYYEVGKRRFRCTSAHGDVDLRMALVESCNVYFWKLAEAVGLERLNHVAEDFGLGARTGLGINSEARGFLASREWYERSGRRFMVGFTMNTAIGQGNTRVTLIQMALAYAALGNGGRLFVPHLVERIDTPDGRSVMESSPEIRRRIEASPEALDLVVSGLYGVVNDPAGTAYESRDAVNVSVAGKTGTAQVERYRVQEGETEEERRYLARAHAWFAGFAPATNPSVAIVVILEHGGGGGRYAAPVAIQILSEHFSRSEVAERLAADGGARENPPATVRDARRGMR